MTKIVNGALVLAAMIAGCGPTTSTLPTGRGTSVDVDHIEADCYQAFQPWVCAPIASEQERDYSLIRGIRNNAQDMSVDVNPWDLKERGQVVNLGPEEALAFSGLSGQVFFDEAFLDHLVDLVHNNSNGCANGVEDCGLEGTEEERDRVALESIERARLALNGRQFVYVFPEPWENPDLSFLQEISVQADQ